MLKDAVTGTTAAGDDRLLNAKVLDGLRIVDGFGEVDVAVRTDVEGVDLVVQHVTLLTFAALFSCSMFDVTLEEPDCKFIIQIYKVSGIKKLGEKLR